MTKYQATPFDIKICGLTNEEDALQAAELGATALGFIFASLPRPTVVDAQSAKSDAPKISRQVSPEFVRQLRRTNSSISKIGVFQNQSLTDVIRLSQDSQVDGIQLHGQESPQWIQELKLKSPLKLFIKAIDVSPELDAKTIKAYAKVVDVILFDAPRIQAAAQRQNQKKLLDQSGKSNSRALNVDRLELLLREVGPLPKFWVAGGLNAENVAATVLRVRPNGVDVASGIEFKSVEFEDARLKKDAELMGRFIRAAKGAADATR